MSTEIPKISVGLPVYNGENFVQEAIDSFRNQTFKDFELIISDNASTDSTKSICEESAAQDARVKYYRSTTNIGASGNYTKVFELASGKYFKWAAHDDICKPDFLDQCCDILDTDPTIVLCYSLTESIDSKGKRLKKWRARPKLNSEQPYDRFVDILSRIDTFPIWGLIRSEVLKRTPLLGNYPAHDRPLLAELSLAGRFYEIQEYLLLDREHQDRSIRMYEPNKPHDTMAWYDPERSGKLSFPLWRLLREYLAAINRSQIDSKDRGRCFLEILKWTRENKGKLSNDIFLAAKHTPIIGNTINKYHTKSLNSKWSKNIKKIRKDIGISIPSGNTFIIVDENTIDSSFFSEWKIFPFLEQGGLYWGTPSDSETAIHELERLRTAGADFIVFINETFWWLDHYEEFYKYLQSQFDCVNQNDNVIIFKLR